jgi:AraC-like DNA-binding protein
MNRNVESLRVFTAPASEAGSYDAAHYLTFVRRDAIIRAPETPRAQAPEGQEGLLVQLPRDFVEKRLVKVNGTGLWRLPESHSGLERLALACIRALQQEVSHLAAPDLQKAREIVSDLLVLALGKVMESRPTVSPIRSANLMRAKLFIRSHCHFASLTPREVAHENGLSLRYLHNLFRDEGQTVSKYIISERLCRARRALEVGSPLTTTVSAVCFSSGFTSLSHFSTAFKRTFAVSPTDILRKRKRVREQFTD